MAAALPFIQIAGTALSAVGAIRQANAQADAADYNAKVASQNAQIAAAQGAAASDMQQRNAARKIGSMVAGYGASGVGGAGSALDVLQDSVRQSTLDNLTTKYNYQVRAAGYTNQANLDSAQADNARTSGLLNAGGEILKGAGGYVKSGYKLPWSS